MQQRHQESDYGHMRKDSLIYLLLKNSKRITSYYNMEEIIIVKFLADMIENEELR
jgi:hypothetical protein